MKQVGAHQARTHLSRLLNAVESGETITITRHGRPVAKLVPFSSGHRTVEEAIEALREFRKSHSLGGLKTKGLIEEGRRY
jgi:prevent-host-death family protein